MGTDSSDSYSPQRLYKLVFEHASEAMVVVDDDGRIVLSNRAARELPGVDLEKLFRWSPGRDPELTSFRAQLRVGSRATCELDLPAPGGVARRFSLEGRAHGPVYSVVMRDVTERRREQRELLHLRSLEAIGFLAASLVHDFNNVLTAMAGSATLLARELPEGEPHDLAQEILSASERGTALVRRALRVLRREPAKPERLNVSEGVTELRGLLDLLVGPAIQLKLELDPDVADTRVDVAQFDHALLNLVANARDAMAGTGELTISTANVSIGPDDIAPKECQAGMGYVAITVTDTGAGMTPEVRERIFERFFTTKDAADSTGAPSSGGTGLGLASVHAFVSQSGGCITVRSAPGAGTTVLFYLPCVAPAQVIALPRAELSAAGGRETILVMEAEDHVRFVVRAALTSRGYFVVDAPTGDLAMRQARLANRQVDLVLADVATPGPDGREVTARLGAEGHAPKLLWMTGLTDRAIAEYGLADAPVLRKAFTPTELVRAVRAALDAEDGSADLTAEAH